MDPKTRAILIEMNRPRHLHPQKTYEKGGHQEKIKPKFKTQLLQKSRKVFKKKVHKKLDLKEKWRSFKDSIPKKKCTMKCCKSFFYELFPFINIMQNYSMRKYLLADLIAGLTVGIIHIPQGKSDNWFQDFLINFVHFFQKKLSVLQNLTSDKSFDHV
ncbi:hypothetical protein KUTeg_021072 [Tegillarca granosa]|uniref:Uncharacterized protein n=1 Tax=Tegillarca granosa TaxID=220873 RepID=A0ABQ9EF67_TEGGR|nr:hypothetical protein KUTeg_021072 [Tegillarca granosa]